MMGGVLGEVRRGEAEEGEIGKGGSEGGSNGRDSRRRVKNSVKFRTIGMTVLV